MMKSSLILLVTFLLVAASASVANAQSQDRENPTALSSGEIQGAGVEQKTAYYYTFDGGPGQVSATLNAKMKKGAKTATIGIDLFDANAKSLSSTLLQEGLGGGKEKVDQLIGNGVGRLTSELDTLTGSTRQRTSSVKVKEKQKLTLRVMVGPGIETYTVKLEGAVEFGQTTASETSQPGTELTESPATESTAASTGQQTPTEEQAPPAQQPAPEAAPSSAQPPVPSQRPAIVRIPGKGNQSGQKPAIVRIPPKNPPQ